MDLLVYLSVIRRRAKQIGAITVVLILLTAFFTTIWGSTRYRAELFVTTASQDTSETDAYRFSNYYNEFSANNFNNAIIGWFDDPSLTRDAYLKAEVDMNANLDFWQKFSRPFAARKRERNNVAISLTAKNETTAQQLADGLFTILQERVAKYNEASKSRYQIIKQGVFISAREPKLGLNLILALLVGLILGVIMVYLYEYAAGKVSYAHEGEEILGQKNLAVVRGWQEQEWQFVHALGKKLGTGQVVLVDFRDRQQTAHKALSSHRILSFPGQIEEIAKLVDTSLLVLYRLGHTRQEQLRRLLHLLRPDQIKPVAIDG